MKTAFITLCITVCSMTVNSQKLPLDFSENSHAFTSFGGSSFSIVQDPSNASNEVGKLDNGGQDPWEGIYLDLGTAVSLDSARIIEMKTYNSTATDKTVLFKLENGSQPNIEVLDTLVGMGWQTLVFDFSKAKYNHTDPTSFVATGSYAKIVLFLNGGIVSSDEVLIDDITGGSNLKPETLDSIYSDLIWSDEFDGNGVLDADKWFHQTQLPAGGSWYNGELQHYTDRQENSSVSNGTLKIVAKKEVLTDQGETKNYTSARLNSKYVFTYGRIDVRAKLPRGNGTWPAIWTLGQNIIEDGGYWSSQYGTTNWPLCGEIDVMEHWNSYNPGVVHGSLHTGSSSGATVNTGTTNISTVLDSFHLYSMNWSPNQISFMVDGEIYYTYNPPIKDINTWPYFESQYILLNIAMGGIGGTIDPNFTESTLEIDYVRIYQNKNIAGGDEITINEDSQGKINVYPNPVQETFNITGLAFDENTELKVFDVLGNAVIQKRINNADFLINASALKEGVYFLEVNQKSGTRITRFLKL
tara:strand:- start:33 stop:1613 length:1581 start_codon:yes stop_codon:yes gene_type:complete